MKSLLLLAAALTLTAAPAFAEEENPTNFCATYHKLATNIMKHRQYTDDVIEALSFSENAAYEKFVITAYEQKRYMTSQMRERQVKEFANDMFIGCLKAFGEDI